MLSVTPITVLYLVTLSSVQLPVPPTTSHYLHDNPVKRPTFCHIHNCLLPGNPVKTSTSCHTHNLPLPSNPLHRLPILTPLALCSLLLFLNHLSTLSHPLLRHSHTSTCTMHTLHTHPFIPSSSCTPTLPNPTLPPSHLYTLSRPLSHTF